MRQINARIKILLLSLFLICIPAYGQEAPAVKILEGANPASIEIINSSNLIVNGHQRISRESAVKVTDLMSGRHGSGTYAKIGKHYVVITARHVAGDSPIFVIQGENGETVLGQLIYMSTTADLAVLKVPQLVTRTSASFKKAELEDFEVGDIVVYTGYPSSYELLTSVAMVSGYEVDYNAVLLQGFAWPGSSGSGVFDSRGKLRGIVVAIGTEEVNGYSAQLIETLVYMTPINENDVSEIERILNSP